MLLILTKLYHLSARASLAVVRRQCSSIWETGVSETPSYLFLRRLVVDIVGSIYSIFFLNSNWEFKDRANSAFF